MAIYEDEPIRLSNRLRDALISDRVMTDFSIDADELLTRRFAPWDWTKHLARQLRLDVDADWRGTAGIVATLEFLLIELDDVIRTWPPGANLERCRAIAHAATSGLTTLEVVTTLLLGPPEWQRAKVAACSVGDLGVRLHPVLEDRLASELHRLLVTWTELDVRKLRERRAEAIAAAEKRREQAEREARDAEREKFKKRERPRREDRPGAGAFYNPPPKV